MKRLSAQATIHLFADDSRKTQLINYLMVYDCSKLRRRKSDIHAAIEQAIENIAHSALPLFSRKLYLPWLRLGRPFWVNDAHLDVRNHLARIALPAPGDWDALCRTISHLHNEPMDMTRPLWDLQVFEDVHQFNHRAGQYFALQLRLHRAALDGCPESELLAAVYGNLPKSSVCANLIEEYPEPETGVSGLAMLGQTVLNLAQVPLSTASTCKALLQQDDHDPAAEASGRAATSEWDSRVTGISTCHSRFFQLSQQQLTTLGELGYSLEVLVFTLISQALRKYLLQKNRLPRGPLSAVYRRQVTPKRDLATGSDRRKESREISLRLVTDIELFDHALPEMGSEIDTRFIGARGAIPGGSGIDLAPASWIEFARLTGHPRLLTCHPCEGDIGVDFRDHLQPPYELRSSPILGISRAEAVERGLRLKHGACALRTATGISLGISTVSCAGFIDNPSLYQHHLEDAFEQAVYFLQRVQKNRDWTQRPPSAASASSLATIGG